MKNSEAYFLEDIILGIPFDLLELLVELLFLLVVSLEVYRVLTLPFFEFLALDEEFTLAGFNITLFWDGNDHS